jgi:hypothetical protein
MRIPILLAALAASLAAQPCDRTAVATFTGDGPAYPGLHELIEPPAQGSLAICEIYVYAFPTQENPPILSFEMLAGDDQWTYGGISPTYFYRPGVPLTLLRTRGGTSVLYHTPPDHPGLWVWAPGASPQMPVTVLAIYGYE